MENADGPAERHADWAERLRTEEGNLGVAIRWFFAHDIAPLPHIFLVLCQNYWLFWQMRDRMPEGRAWIEELLLRADALDAARQAELLLISAVTAVEVGDDDSARAAVEAIERLDGRIDDPYARERGAARRLLDRCRSPMTSMALCRPRRRRSMASASRTIRFWRGRR